jgi:hypothetical protein
LEYLENNDRGLKLHDANVEVDHIKPYDAFKHLDTAIEQELVNNWRNLQLLTKEENGKGGKGAEHDHDAWAKTGPGMKLIAFEGELRKAAEGDDRAVEYVDTSSSSDEFSDDEESSEDDE